MKKLIYCLALLCPLFSMCQTITIKGNVINEEGNPVPAATITIKGTTNATVANSKGEFTLTGTKLSDSIIVSAIGYQTTTEPNNERGLITVTLKRKVTQLDETVIIAYGTTTRRFNTGNVAKVAAAADIAAQPVANPLAALQGRVPGLFISQTSGLPGASFNVQIRGQSSITQGSQPLYIIDGVPFMFNSGNLGILNPSVQNPLNSINNADIESIEILKDADATAIYGSQGANGVVLITTKKAKAGKTSLDVNIWQGWGKVNRSVNLLGTEDYLQMRREAFLNDNKTPTASTAPDLLLWSSNRYTNWKQLLIGGTAKTTNIQATLAGGSAQTAFQLSTAYFREASVFPYSTPADRGSLRLTINHQDAKNRFRSSFITASSIETKRLPVNDLTTFIYLPPNAPDPFDSLGNLRWADGIDNPFSYRLNTYKSKTVTASVNSNMQYRIVPGLEARLNIGYQYIMLNESRRTPIKAQRPATGTTGSAQQTWSSLNSWIIEPQLFYKTTGSFAHTELLAGLSFQERVQQGASLTGTMFTNDDLLGNMASAGQLSVVNTQSKYRYQAAFGRFTFRRLNKYILNFNVRRDGSSRFGPANRFSSFAAAGAAWIFTEEKWLKPHSSVVSFGKLRASYGVTGNDQVGDYQYLDSWTSLTSYQYQGAAGILPARLFNETFGWERTKKLEAALEWNMLKDRFSFTVSWFRNRSNNQLLFVTLPAQTGFASILTNLDAAVQNTGWEITASSININHNNWFWKTELNLTIPRNKLLQYPGLASSVHRFTYAIGQPLSVVNAFSYQGVNPQTGIYSFADIDQSGSISSPNDLQQIGWVGPRIFAGMLNTVRFKNIEFTWFMQYVQQVGRNSIAGFSAVPGTMSNQPSYVMDRWTKPGTQSTTQMFTSGAGSAAFVAHNNLRASSAAYTDASFFRLKNLSLNWSLPARWLGKTKLQALRVFTQAQNLLTITNFKGADPESQSMLSLPPLRIITTGIQITF